MCMPAHPDYLKKWRACKQVTQNVNVYVDHHLKKGCMGYQTHQSKIDYIESRREERSCDRTELFWEKRKFIQN